MLHATMNLARLIGADMLDRDGDKIGTIKQIYVHPTSGAPLWASVKTGMFGSKETFIPLDTASTADDAIRVDYEKSFVKHAPRVDPEGALSPAEEDTLHAYYGKDDSGDASNRDDERERRRDADAGAHEDGDADRREDSDARDDSARTRDADEHGGADPEAPRVTGRARLHRYVVTEEKTVTVPVSREEVRLETEPVSGSDPHAGGTAHLDRDESDGPRHVTRDDDGTASRGI